MWLGWVAGSGKRYFDGKIGEVLIYDEALTAEEFVSKLAALSEKWLRSGPPVEMCNNQVDDDGDVFAANGKSHGLAAGYKPSLSAATATEIPAPPAAPVPSKNPASRPNPAAMSASLTMA